MDRVTRKMTFEEEAAFYEKEAMAEFAKETGDGDCSDVNGILRRGMRIIYKARQEIASRLPMMEVVHGRWEHDSIGFSDFWTCSACRKDFFFDDDPTIIHARVNYCPNCGAKMDGDGNA